MDLQKEISWLLKEKYNGSPSEKFYKDVVRLKAGEPVDYVIGFAEFLGCKIDLSKRPLIPRVETEYWVREAIKEMKGRRILDMFAGSGCIGIAILRHVKNAKVDFADKHKYFNSPNFIKSDIFSNIRGKYDYIFANPPYIPKTRKKKLPKSVVNFEPKQALFGGKNGLYFIKRFLCQARAHLNKNGKIFIEFDSPQKKEIEKLIKKFGYKNFQFHHDQFGKWRWVAIS